MPGMKLLTKFDSQACLKLAWRTAQDLGYTLTPSVLPEAAKSFTAEKGSVMLSLLAGAFSPHCRFRITVESYKDANEVILEPNKPWLSTGSVGVGKVQQRAQELFQAIAAAIENAGGEVSERKDF